MEGKKLLFALVMPNSTRFRPKQQVVKRNDETLEFCESFRFVKITLADYSLRPVNPCRLLLVRHFFFLVCHCFLADTHLDCILFLIVFLILHCAGPILFCSVHFGALLQLHTSTRPLYELERNITAHVLSDTARNLRFTLVSDSHIGNIWF